MPRTEEQNKEARERMRQKILDAALKLFARDGYDATPVKRIAQEAGIAQGLLYHYFASKEDVVRAIFTECMAQIQDSFAHGRNGNTPAERLERLIRRSFEIVRANSDFWRLTYAIRFQPAVHAGLQPAMEAWIVAIRETLETHLRDLGFTDPETEAILLFALIDGVSQHYTIQPETYPLDAAEEAMIARYCRAGE